MKNKLFVFIVFLFSFLAWSPNVFATAPSVTPLGDGETDYILPSTCPSVACDRGHIYGAQIDFIVDDELDSDSKTAVENAIRDGASTEPDTFQWYNNSIRIYSSSPIIFDEDILVTVTDIDSDEEGPDTAETTENLLIIDSSDTEASEIIFAGGYGSEEDPFQIGTCEQLQNVNYYASGSYYFTLYQDVDCSETEEWNEDPNSEGTYLGFMPLGETYDNNNDIEYGNSFLGIFDGNEYTISNLYINRPTYDYVGLFGQVEQAEIINIGLIDVNITGNNIVGGLVGSNIQGHIENTYTTGNVIGQIEVGGLVGESSDTPFTITGSHSEADVGGIGFIGGLVGANFLSNIYNSYATGDITGSYQNIPAPYQGFGGLVGINVGGHIEDTYATGDVEGIFAGGLVGTTVGYDTIVSSYATGDVTGSVVGGLVGYNNVDDIHNSYSTGKVIGEGSELFESMKIGMGGEELADVYYIAGGLIGVMIYEGESVDNYVFNSGWYQSRDNSNLSGIGMVGYSDDGIIFEGPAEVTYTETNNRAFYSKNHGVYDQTGEYVWNFNGNPWYEYSNDYPKFVEQEGGRRTGRSSGGSGSSTAVIASFQAEQLARAIATGVDTTPYLNPSNSSGQVPNPQPSVSDGQSPTFGRTLKQGMTGEDVRQLQIYLNTHGYPVATEGDGSLNHETTYFGLKTKQAVIKFQIANGLISDGVVGPLTQSKMN